MDPHMQDCNCSEGLESEAFSQLGRTEKSLSLCSINLIYDISFIMILMFQLLYMLVLARKTFSDEYSAVAYPEIKGNRAQVLIICF